MCSQKVTQFCEISTVDLTCITFDKSMVETSQNFGGLLKTYELYNSDSRTYDLKNCIINSVNFRTRNNLNKLCNCVLIINSVTGCGSSGST